MKRHFIVLALLVFPVAARGEDIAIATYNIENFRQLFMAHRFSTTRPSWLPRRDPQATELLNELRDQNDEDCWEVAQVILDSKFSPDVLVIQEGCNQSDLEYFNKRWLGSAYETAIVFSSNTTRDQHIGMLLKPGFKVLQRNDQYHLEPDTVDNDRGLRMFARGPAFALVQSPGGYRFWVGTNHQKSKSGNSVKVTAWRNREAKRTQQIIKELERTGPDDVIFLGDMNDELGIQEYEMAGGGDVIANLVGPESDGLVLATKPLIDGGQISFGGYWRTDHRSLIDHVIVTRPMKEQVKDISVFRNEFTSVASDHYPVLVHVRSDPVVTVPAPGN